MKEQIEKWITKYENEITDLKIEQEDTLNGRQEFSTNEDEILYYENEAIINIYNEFIIKLKAVLKSFA